MPDDRTLAERISDNVAKFGGSWKFVILFIVTLLGWVLINSLAIISWDNYPFILLNLLLSCIAALQAPFIMMSQNRTERKQDLAYRKIFRELKELVQQNLDREREIHEELGELKQKINILFQKLQQAVLLEEMNRQDLAELIEHYEEASNQE